MIFRQVQTASDLAGAGRNCAARHKILRIRRANSTLSGSRGDLRPRCVEENGTCTVASAPIVVNTSTLDGGTLAIAPINPKRKSSAGSGPGQQCRPSPQGTEEKAAARRRLPRDEASETL